MVMDTCLRTEFAQGYRTPNPRSFRTQHLLLTPNKHGPQKQNKNSTLNSGKHDIKCTNV